MVYSLYFLLFPNTSLDPPFMLVPLWFIQWFHHPSCFFFKLYFLIHIWNTFPIVYSFLNFILNPTLYLIPSSSNYCCSVAQSCPMLCNPMDWSIPGLSVPHHLLRFAQVHVHCIGDAIQPSHPLMPSSPSALNLSQYQGLFQRVSCLHQMTKILEFQLQHQSLLWVFRLISLKIDWFDLLAVL